MTAWALTYLLHSSVLILLAWLAARSPWGRAPLVRDAIWKTALLGALVTATVHQATGGSPSLAPAIRLSDVPRSGPRAVIDAGMLWLAAVSVAGSFVLATRLACGWLRLRRQAGRRRIVGRGPLREALVAILRDAGVTRRITLSCSRGLAVPRAIGAGEICIPVRALRDLSAAEQRALLAHEVAHLQRRDGVWLFAGALLQTLAWWQPLTRLAVARMRHSMELCCDDWAAAQLPDRMALAECLVKVGEWSVPASAGLHLAGFAAHGSALRERVERILDDADVPLVRRPWPALVPLLAVIGFAPCVILAEPAIVASLAAPVMRQAAAPARGDETARPGTVPGRTGRAVRSGSAVQRLAAVPPAPRAADVDDREAARVDAPEARSVAPETSPAVITMSDPLTRPSPPGLRTAIGAVRGVPAPPAPPQPLIGKAEAGLRFGVWLEERRNSLLDRISSDYYHR